MAAAKVKAEVIADHISGDYLVRLPAKQTFSEPESTTQFANGSRFARLKSVRILQLRWDQLGIAPPPATTKQPDALVEPDDTQTLQSLPYLSLPKTQSMTQFHLRAHYLLNK